MATITPEVLLQKVKLGLGISGDYQNETLNLYIDEVKEFMLSAGVPQSVVDSTTSVGCIMRGVADLWDLGNGTAKFSEYFKQRVIQLTLVDTVSSNGTVTPDDGNDGLSEVVVNVPQTEEA